jgi:cation transport regulator ChaB
MPYATNADLPDAVKEALPQAQARGIWRNTFNSQQKRGLSEQRCFQSAWAAVKNAGFEKDEETGKWHKVEKVSAQVSMPIAKSDDARQLIFGWASIAADHEGNPVLDSQGDLIDLEDLEEAFYDYVKSSGTLNFMHDGPVRGQLVEALVFTPEKLVKLGIPAGTVPYGAWVGYHIPDATDYAMAKADGLLMFSIEGSAQREEV